jgi:hypothetical protein
MTAEFMHPELGNEVRTFAGYYVSVEEHIFPFHGREVIYILGHACIEASCCGAAHWGYIQVPGFLVKKHIRSGEKTLPVSEIEMIRDEEARNAIWQSLMEKYPGARIEIW